MPILDIRLQNFRSYNDETFEFEPGVNIIVGPNASGKTNLLDGIQIACLGMSHRSRDHELIRHHKNWARIDINLEDNPRTVKIEKISDDQATKQFVINSQPLKRFKLDKSLPMILFEPNHLQMLVGSPELRRDYLDNLIEQTVADFGQTRAKYRRTLAQRNALLKKGHSVAQKQVFSWDLRLSQLAGEIVHQRLHIIGAVNEQLEALYQKLAKSQTNLKLDYKSNSKLKNYETNLLKELQQNLELDVLRGFTAKGPHRDDFVVIMDNQPASLTASRGEIRTILLALKIIEVRLIERARGQKPLLLLDDVFSELDGARRRSLTRFLKKYQTFITTTDADVVVRHFMNNCHIIPLLKKN